MDYPLLIRGLRMVPARRITARLWVVLALVVAVPLQAAGAQRQVRDTGVIEGVVEDPAGGRIVGVELTVSNLRVRTFSNDTGGFRLLGVPAGSGAVRLRRLGYAPGSIDFVLDSGATQRRELTMEPMAVSLSPLIVTAPERPVYTGWAARFYQRRDRGTGRYITREEIDQRNPTYVTDLLRSLPGVQIRPSRFASRTVYFRGQRCPPFVWIDNSPGLAGYLDVDNFQPGSLEGIEVYSSPATIPGELSVPRNMASCGMIVLWTRMPERRAPESRTRYTAEDLANLVESLRVYTAAQVDTAAHLADGEALDVGYPASMRSRTLAANLVVEFIVDTAGRVEMDTFGIVTPAESDFVESVRVALPSVHFVPALLNGRKVRQVVQLPVRFDPPEQRRSGER